MSHSAPASQRGALGSTHRHPAKMVEPLVEGLERLAPQAVRTRPATGRELAAVTGVVFSGPGGGRRGRQHRRLTDGVVARERIALRPVLADEGRIVAVPVRAANRRRRIPARSRRPRRSSPSRSTRRWRTPRTAGTSVHPGRLRCRSDSRAERAGPAAAAWRRTRRPVASSADAVPVHDPFSVRLRDRRRELRLDLLHALRDGLGALGCAFRAHAALSRAFTPAAFSFIAAQRASPEMASLNVVAHALAAASAASALPGHVPFASALAKLARSFDSAFSRHFASTPVPSSSGLRPALGLRIHGDRGCLRLRVGALHLWRHASEEAHPGARAPGGRRSRCSTRTWTACSSSVAPPVREDRNAAIWRAHP